MEFVFQILADLLSPVDEKQVKAEAKQIAEQQAKESIAENVEQTPVEEPNIFGIMDFH
jgi:hypothetical protein